MRKTPNYSCCEQKEPQRDPTKMATGNYKRRKLERFMMPTSSNQTADVRVGEKRAVGASKSVRSHPPHLLANLLFGWRWRYDEDINTTTTIPRSCFLGDRKRRAVDDER